LRAQQRRSTGGKPRFRLRDVGARHFTDIEAVTRLLQLLGEHFDVAAIEIEDRLVAQQIHVRGRGVERTCCSVTRNVSRAPITWLSAWRVRLAVWKPLIDCRIMAIGASLPEVRWTPKPAMDGDQHWRAIRSGFWDLPAAQA
jgi:hypothetical protein